MPITNVRGTGRPASPDFEAPKRKLSTSLSPAWRALRDSPVTPWTFRKAAGWLSAGFGSGVAHSAGTPGGANVVADGDWATEMTAPAPSAAVTEKATARVR